MVWPVIPSAAMDVLVVPVEPDSLCSPAVIDGTVALQLLISCSSFLISDFMFCSVATLINVPLGRQEPGGQIHTRQIIVMEATKHTSRAQACNHATVQSDSTESLSFVAHATMTGPEISQAALFSSRR